MPDKPAELARVAECDRDEGYGDDDARAAGLRLDESVRDISVLLALDELMRLHRRQNADARDNARARHRRFRHSDALWLPNPRPRASRGGGDQGIVGDLAQRRRAVQQDNVVPVDEAVEESA